MTYRDGTKWMTLFNEVTPRLASQAFHRTTDSYQKMFSLFMYLSRSHEVALENME